jgi:hypothetical protein
MNSNAYTDLGLAINTKLTSLNYREAKALLGPILLERVHFYHLEKIGSPIGKMNSSISIPCLEWIAKQQAEGGWVIIAAALKEWLPERIDNAFYLCQKFIKQADVWYAADIFGERVPGPALLLDFNGAINFLSPWRSDLNAWIRRTVGVAVHFWAKRTRGEIKYIRDAEILLSFMEELFSENEINAVKGVGWGLKTMGRYYSDLTTEWLRRQVQEKKKPIRKLMLKKSLTWLSKQQRAYIFNLYNDNTISGISS